MECAPDVAAAKRACAPKSPLSPQAFADRLRTWRKARILTQPRADALFCSLGVQVAAATWGKWERADQTPWPSFMRRVLAALALAPRPTRPPPTSRLHPHREMPMCPRKFRRLLRRWRKACGLNQAEACVLLGLPPDQSLLSNYERGKAIPRTARMSALLAIIAGTEVQP